MSTFAKTQHKVAVIGAGLSGLTAAYELCRNGYQVVVFEAKDKPGGRCQTVHMDNGQHGESGGEAEGVSEVPFHSNIRVSEPKKSYA